MKAILSATLVFGLTGAAVLVVSSFNVLAGGPSSLTTPHYCFSEYTVSPAAAAGLFR